jgi:hypothetical protein
VTDQPTTPAAPGNPTIRYPHPDGEYTVLGPEIFASKDGEVICWKGENYVRQTPQVADDSRLRARYADALWEANGPAAAEDANLDAVMGVRDRYLEQLAAGRETWKRKAIEMEADRDHWLRFIERVTTNHMQFSVIRADRSVQELPCADWCYACKRDELKKLKSCISSHCVEGDHVFDLGPGEEIPELPSRGCGDWHRSEDHDAHEWPSAMEGIVKCPGWSSEGMEGDTEGPSDIG